MCYYCGCHNLSCKSPISYVEVQAMFGTVIICSLSSGKEEKGTGRNSWNTAMFVTGAIWGFTCFEFCWACLKKQPQKSLLREWPSTLETVTGTRSQNRSQLRGCSSVLSLSSRSLHYVTTSGTIKYMVYTGTTTVYQTDLLKYLLSHQHDAPQCLRGSLQT